MTYAGFWKRFAAYTIDGIIYGIISGLINSIVSFILQLALGNDPSVGTALTALLVGIIISLAVWAAYYAWPESSSWQATIGKKIFGLRVVKVTGERISFWRAFWRNFAKIFSAIILCIGYLMCSWTQKKQCLHDMMADCVVVDDTPGQKTGCVIAVIAVGIILPIFLIGILAAIALPQYTRAVGRARTVQTSARLNTVMFAQQRYFMKNETYARSWDALDIAIPGCENAQGATCQTADAVYELKYNGVSATSTTDAKYRLFQSYDSNDVKCEALNTQAEAICAQFND